jgi:eukaryotic-like serine/threonine-protein kinase
MSADARIHELVLRWKECREQGQPLSVEDLCGTCPELLSEVKREIGELERLSQPPTPTDAGKLDYSATQPTPPAPTPSVPSWAPPWSRFRPIAFHAEGGLGEVFKARDSELRREVALKRMKRPYAGHADTRRRFLREAEITGGLEHPGVVPVYGVGQDADGQPCYAMRFIRGESLKDAIRRFHDPATRSRDPGARRLALRQLLTRFISVCNTIAFAHSRGIIHRDLKPGNIMLGEYGETLVVDWGLAKPVGPAEEPDGGASPTPEEDATATRTGEAVGTPVYMSPEQAQGRRDLIGPASDIYSLGATLFSLLTSRAPFEGTTHSDVLNRVRSGIVLPPRRIDPSVPAPLQAICLKAMALDPAARYATALDLAADLERWLADEPVAAYREPLWARAGRWARRHKPLVAGTAALLLTALILGSGFGLWRKWERNAVEAGVRGDLQRAADHERQGAWTDVLRDVERAEGRLGSGAPAELRQRIDAVKGEIDLVASLEAARLKQAERIDTGSIIIGDQIIETRFNPAAMIELEQNRNREATRAAYAAAFANHGLDLNELEPEDAAARIAASPIREPLIVALDEWSFTLVGTEKGEADRLTTIARGADDNEWRNRLRDPSVRSDPAALKDMARDPRALKLSPSYLVFLSYVLRVEHASDAALDLLRQGQQRNPHDFWINFQLANGLHDRGPSAEEEAVGFYRAALATRPKTGAVLNNLALALRKLRRLRNAEEASRQALEADPNSATAHNTLGLILRDLKKPAEAEAEFRTAIERGPKFATGWGNLGLVLFEKGESEAGMDAFQKALALALDDPTMHTMLGAALLKSGKLPDADAEFRQAIKLRDCYAAAWTNLGVALQQQHKPEDALRAFRKAVDCDPEDASCRNNLGRGLCDLGKLNEAEIECRMAVALDPHDALAHANLAVVLQDLNRLDQAVAEYRESLAIEPLNGRTRSGLGVALMRLWRLDEALDESKRAVDSLPDDLDLRVNLSVVLNARGDFAAAETEARKVIQARHGFAEAHNALAGILRDSGRPAEGAKEARVAVSLKADLLDAYFVLAGCLEAQGEFAQAVDEYKKCQEKCAQRFPASHPRLVGLRNMLGMAEYYVTLERRLPNVIKDFDKPANAQERCHFGWLCQTPRHKLYGQSVRIYDQAFGAEPGLLDDLQWCNRYNAARAAALAGCGKGEDEAKPDDAERARLRRQAHAWLKADLPALIKLRGGPAPEMRAAVDKRLRLWLIEPDLECVREADALAALPEEEQAGWRRLWEDVRKAIE